MGNDEGFTLIESLMVMSILAILLAISLPNLQSTIERQAGMQLLRSIADSVAVGRSTAIKSGLPVTLCPSSDGLSCAGEWLEGHILFIDRNLDRIVDVQDQLIRMVALENAAGELTWRVFQNRQYLQITPQGFTRHQNGSFTWCGNDRSPLTAQQLIINSSGRLRYAVDADGDGFREDSKGQPLTC